MEKIKRVCSVYFSPTKTTKLIVESLSNKISQRLNIEKITIDITYPKNRVDELYFNEDELLIIGYPVYAGRIPNLMLKHILRIHGNNTKCIPIVLYGNRAFDDALLELKDIMDEQGFTSIAAGAFVGQHSFSNTLAAGRPDKADLEELDNFANQINFEVKPLNIPGKTKEERAYFQPKAPSGTKINILKVIPETSDKCIHCGKCVSHCPMGSIDSSNPSLIIGPCIKCNACVRICPVNAKSFTDEGYLTHLHDLEIRCARRGENYTFI